MVESYHEENKNEGRDGHVKVGPVSVVEQKEGQPSDCDFSEAFQEILGVKPGDLLLHAVVSYDFAGLTADAYAGEC